MGERYKTCEMHGKPFPHNQVDTEKTEMAKVYIERKEKIEGDNVTLTLFIGKSDNEGIDVCAQCLQDKIMTPLADSDEHPTFKQVTWHKETMTKKDGSGTYEKNVKTVRTPEEVKAVIISDRKGQK